MSRSKQLSFAAGEVTDDIYARIDTVRRQTGVRRLRNVMLTRHGAPTNRPGTGFVGASKIPSKRVNILQFVYSDTVSYLLEFGDKYLKFIYRGAYVTETPKNITAATSATPPVVTSNAHGFNNGDIVDIAGVVGEIELNGRQFKVANKTANTFELQDLDGNNIVGVGYAAYVSGGTVAREYTITTPYVEADLQDLKLTVAGNVATITHKNYFIRDLTYTAPTNWTLSVRLFKSDIGRPTGCDGVAGAAGAATFRYAVTAVSATGEESPIGCYKNPVFAGGATQNNPVVVTSPAHGLANGQLIRITLVVGMEELNEREFLIKNVAANTFELTDLSGNNIDGTAFGAYVSGGTIEKLGIVIINAATPPTIANPNVISWTPVIGAVKYIVYELVNGSYGKIGDTYNIGAGWPATASFNDTGIAPDYSKYPPSWRHPFSKAGDFPSVGAYFQQRMWFGGTINSPDTLYSSRTINLNNFMVSIPSRDDDAITQRILGNQVNEIRNLMELFGTFLCFTSGSENEVAGNSDGVLTYSGTKVKPHSRNGSTTLKPLEVSGDALYVQARGSQIDNLVFEIQSESYRPSEISLFASHLVDGYTITSWAYQRNPNSTIWMVRSDGKLLGMTYVREQQIIGWHQHDLGGAGVVENVAVVPEAGEDVLYLLVKRTINGGTKRYVERLKNRLFTDIKNAVFMDSALTYDGRNTDGSKTMTLSGGTTWTYTDTLTLTASSAFFTASDVGNRIDITGADGTVIRCTIKAYTSATVVSVHPHKTVPVSMRSVARSTWAKAIKTVTGLWHLEGKTLSIFGDGFVMGSPNNAGYPTYTVSAGKITLKKPRAVIQAGLPYLSQMWTLDVDTLQGETLMGKFMNVENVAVYLKASRGVWAGGRPPTDETVDPLEGLTEFKLREDENYDQPVTLTTGVVDVPIEGEWNSNGSIFLQQVDPIPMTILAAVAAGEFPGEGQG